MSTISKIAVTSIILVALIVSTIGEVKTPQIAVLEQPEPQKVTLLPELVHICACESTGKVTGMPTHWDKNGNVIHGKINPKDIGMCQINAYYNEKEALSHGWDIYTEQGNIQMANYMYKTQGSRPWNWSKPCWGNTTK